jgi:hypothetical protein
VSRLLSSVVRCVVPVIGGLDGYPVAREDVSGRGAWTRISVTPRSGTASADEDALTVWIKVRVRDNEPFAFARTLRQFHKLTRFRDKGPFRWMCEASRANGQKTYYLKPSFLRRLKRVRKRFLAQKWSYCFEGGRPPD